MSRQVFKWQFADLEQLVPWVAGTRVVLIAAQQTSDRLPTVWVDYPTDQLTNDNPMRRLQIVGTGDRFPDELEHLGSAVCADGRLVWHVFGDPL